MPAVTAVADARRRVTPRADMPWLDMPWAGAATLAVQVDMQADAAVTVVVMAAATTAAVTDVTATNDYDYNGCGYNPGAAIVGGVIGGALNAFGAY